MHWYKIDYYFIVYLLYEIPYLKYQPIQNFNYS